VVFVVLTRVFYCFSIVDVKDSGRDRRRIYLNIGLKLVSHNVLVADKQVLEGLSVIHATPHEGGYCKELSV